LGETGGWVRDFCALRSAICALIQEGGGRLRCLCAAARRAWEAGGCITGVAV